MQIIASHTILSYQPVSSGLLDLRGFEPQKKKNNSCIYSFE